MRLLQALIHVGVAALITLLIFMVLSGAFAPAMIVFEIMNKGLYLAGPMALGLLVMLLLPRGAGFRGLIFLGLAGAAFVLVALGAAPARELVGSPPSLVLAGVGPYEFTAFFFFFILAAVTSILSLRIGAIGPVATVYAGVLAALFLAFDAPMALIYGVYNKVSFMLTPGLPITVTLDGSREGRRTVVLTDDWFYCHDDTGNVYRVPRGFESDFASIPWYAQFLIGSFGNHAEAAVVHDWLYAVGEGGTDADRARVDSIFRDVMEEKGVNPLKRSVMHAAVRFGGGAAYGREDEWRFLNPETIEPMPAPIAKPTTAAVTNMNCQAEFSRDNPALDAFRTTGRSRPPGGFTLNGGLRVPAESMRPAVTLPIRRAPDSE